MHIFLQGFKMGVLGLLGEDLWGSLIRFSGFVVFMSLNILQALIILYLSFRSETD